MAQTVAFQTFAPGIVSNLLFGRMVAGLEKNIREITFKKITYINKSEYEYKGRI